MEPSNPSCRRTGVGSGQRSESVALNRTRSRLKRSKSLIGRWLELSELERRAFAAMARELTATSSVIENSAIDLSQRFQTLAESARAQVSRVEAIATTARSIEVGGQKVALVEATNFIEDVLVKVINTVLAVSKNAMRMVYSLDDVIRGSQRRRPMCRRAAGDQPADSVPRVERGDRGNPRR